MNKHLGYIVVVTVLGAITAAHADTRPPVKITFAPDSPQAVAGQPYVGVWRVNVGVGGLGGLDGRRLNGGGCILAAAAGGDDEGERRQKRDGDRNEHGAGAAEHRSARLRSYT